MELDPRSMKHESTYKLLIGCVVPRPIAWVSTMGPGTRMRVSGHDGVVLLVEHLH